MANIKSQIKRNRTNEVKREKNASFKSEIKTAEKKVRELAAANQKAEANEALKAAIKLLDQASAKNVLSTNAANRRKSHLQVIVNNIK